MKEGNDLSTYTDDLHKEVDNLEATLNISAIGAQYNIGPLEITTVLGNLVLLSSLNSPLVSTDLSEGDELDYDDCVEAIYVLAKGKEALRPIMSISQRISDFMLLKPMLKDSPDMLEKLLDRTEQISNARVTFTEMAREFYEKEFVGYDFNEVINGLITSISDIMKSSKNLPSASVDDISNPINDKKKL